MIGMPSMFENLLANVGIDTPELIDAFREFNPFATLSHSEFAQRRYIRYRDVIMEHNRNNLSFINFIRQANDANDMVMSLAEQLGIAKIEVMIDDCMRKTCDYKTFTGKAIFETKCENKIREKWGCSLIPIRNLFDDNCPTAQKHYKKPPRFFHHEIDVNEYSAREYKSRGNRTPINGYIENIKGESIPWKQ